MLRGGSSKNNLHKLLMYLYCLFVILSSTEDGTQMAKYGVQLLDRTELDQSLDHLIAGHGSHQPIVEDADLQMKKDQYEPSESARHCNSPHKMRWA